MFPQEEWIDIRKAVRELDDARESKREAEKRLHKLLNGIQYQD
jgi:hypothetical protein